MSTAAASCPWPAWPACWAPCLCTCQEAPSLSNGAPPQLRRPLQAHLIQHLLWFMCHLRKDGSRMSNLNSNLFSTSQLSAASSLVLPTTLLIACPFTLHSAMHVLLVPKLVWHGSVRMPQGYEGQRTLERRVMAQFSSRSIGHSQASYCPVPLERQTKRLVSALKQGNPMKSWRLQRCPRTRHWLHVGSIARQIGSYYPSCSLPPLRAAPDDTVLSLASLRTSVLRLRNGKERRLVAWGNSAIVQQLWGNANLQVHLRAWMHFLYSQNETLSRSSLPITLALSFWRNPTVLAADQQEFSRRGKTLELMSLWAIAQPHGWSISTHKMERRDSQCLVFTFRLEIWTTAAFISLSRNGCMIRSLGKERSSSPIISYKVSSVKLGDEDMCSRSFYCL